MTAARRLPAWTHIHRIETLEHRTLLSSFPVTFGSATFDSAYKVAATPDGGAVVAGLFSETADFDPSSGKKLLTSVGDTDVYVARYSSAGALVWAKQFGGDEGDIDTDSGTIDTPVDPYRAGKFDEGVGLYPQQLGEYINSVALDPSGNVVLNGTFRGTVDFDPGAGKAELSSFGGKSFVDIFLVKLTVNGDLIYARQIGGRFTDVANGFTLDASGNMYLTGYFTRSCDFDPGSRKLILNTKGREDSFVAKYNSDGKPIWARSSSTEEIDRVKRSTGNSVAVDGSGNVVVTGSFSGETDFTPLLQPTLLVPDDKTDVFVEKFSPNGTFIWVKSFGGPDYDGGLAIDVGPDGSIYTGSYFEDTIDADPGPRKISLTATPEKPGDDPEHSDLLISKLDGNGVLVWVKQLGSSGWETLGDLEVDAGGNVYTTGGFYQSIDFNPGRGKAVLTSTLGLDEFDDPNDNDRDYSYDAFLWKLNSNGAYVFATRFGQAGDDYGIDLSLDSTGRPLVAGQFRGTYVFPNANKKLRPIGLEDSFIALFGTNGQIV